MNEILNTFEDTNGFVDEMIDDRIYGDALTEEVVNLVDIDDLNVRSFGVNVTHNNIVSVDDLVMSSEEERNNLNHVIGLQVTVPFALEELEIPLDMSILTGETQHESIVVGINNNLNVESLTEKNIVINNVLSNDTISRNASGENAEVYKSGCWFAY